MRSPKAVTLFTYKPESLTPLSVRLREGYVLTVNSPANIHYLRHFSKIILFHFCAQQDSSLAELQLLRRLAPHAYILVLADSPSAEEIIAIYEQGVQACQMLPVKPDDLCRQLDEITIGWWERLSAWVSQLVQRKRTTVQTIDVKPKKANPPASVDFDLYVRFFGEFRLETKDGREIDLKGLRTQSILACLLHHRNRGISRHRLMEYFWPDCSYESARNSLNVAICQLRQYLRPYLEAEELILFSEDRYFISKELKIRTDFDQFQLHWNRAKTCAQLNEADEEAEGYRAALAFYQGDFLDNLRRYDWTGPSRDNLWETRLYMLEQLNTYYIQHDRYKEAITNGQLILQQDGCLEKVHRQVMLCHYRMGNRGRALKQYHKCCEILREELDALPSRETTEVYEMMLRQKMSQLNIALF